MAPAAPSLKQHGHFSQNATISSQSTRSASKMSKIKDLGEPEPSQRGKPPPQIRHDYQSRLFVSSCNLYPQIAENMESLCYNYRHIKPHSASSNMSTVLKLTQSLCADCGGFRSVEQPLKAHLKADNPTPSKPAAIFISRLLIVIYPINNFVYYQRPSTQSHTQRNGVRFLRPLSCVSSF